MLAFLAAKRKLFSSMGFNNLIEKRNQRKAQRAIRVQAGGAADVIASRVIEGVEPPYRFNAQKPPGSMSSKEFGARVGHIATSILSELFPTVPVDYDADATEQASTEFAAIKSVGKVAAEDVIVVFSQRPLTT